MTGSGFRARILIVDDVAANIKLLAEALKENYQISFARSGEEALRLLGREPAFDLILLDIMMPGMSGYELCQRLKADPATRNVPVIFITAKSEESDETHGLALGAVDYITKPFSMPIVQARVRTHLELKRHRDLLENLSSLDGLTGIPNRRRFDEVARREWKQALRDRTPISLILIDIDAFKAFNDHYGHLGGDDCLKQVAAALSDAIRRPSDFLARYGGEEFVSLLPRTDEAGAVLVAEGMRRAVIDLGIPHARSTAGSRLTISLGVATCVPNLDRNLSGFINEADRALYRAKDAGRDRTEALSLE
jgi:diguanylate cyclase (GGDEF)-like protein